MKEKDYFGDTVLTLASQFSSIETVFLLVDEFNADIQEKGHSGRNSFLCAAKGGKIKIMRFLHSKDENLLKGKDDSGMTALLLACRYASTETVKILIREFKANMFEYDQKYGRTTYLWASEGRKHETMIYLKELEKSMSILSIHSLCQEVNSESDGRNFYRPKEYLYFPRWTTPEIEDDVTPNPENPFALFKLTDQEIEKSKKCPDRLRYYSKYKTAESMSEIFEELKQRRIFERELHLKWFNER